MVDKTRKIIWLDFPDSIIKFFEIPLSNTVTERSGSTIKNRDNKKLLSGL